MGVKRGHTISVGIVAFKYTLVSIWEEMESQSGRKKTGEAGAQGWVRYAMISALCAGRRGGVAAGARQVRHGAQVIGPGDFPRQFLKQPHPQRGIGLECFAKRFDGE